VRDEPSLASQLLLAQEAERKGIARELHSGVGQQLAALTLIASKLKRQIAASAGAELAGEFDVIHARLGDIARGLQGLSRQLYPAVLEHAGIVAALDSFCSAVSLASGTPVEFAADGEFDHLPPDEALCLYRVAQGALKNIAGRASVTLRAVDDGVELDIAGPTGDRFESSIIRERAQLAGGEVQIRSEPEAGVRFFLRK
jgi:signal transduction histidine kinase